MHTAAVTATVTTALFGLALILQIHLRVRAGLTPFHPVRYHASACIRLTARPGDRILIGGPGPKKLLNPEADWFLLAGDMTALPAISVNLSLLPDDARGYAVLEVMTSDDIQPLTCPPGIELIWVVNPQPGADHHPLLEQVEQLAWHEGQPAVWAACEFSSMRALRRYFKQQRQLPKSHLYISSYWKMGSSETQHKIIKREDEEQELAGG